MAPLAASKGNGSPLLGGDGQVRDRLQRGGSQQLAVFQDLQEGLPPRPASRPGVQSLGVQFHLGAPSPNSVPHAMPPAARSSRLPAQSYKALTRRGAPNVTPSVSVVSFESLDARATRKDDRRRKLRPIRSASEASIWPGKVGRDRFLTTCPGSTCAISARPERLTRGLASSYSSMRTDGMHALSCPVSYRDRFFVNARHGSVARGRTPYS